MCTRLPKVLIYKVIERLDFKDMNSFMRTTKDCFAIYKSKKMWDQVLDYKYGAQPLDRNLDNLNMDERIKLFSNTLETTLVNASQKGYKKVVIYALEHGADIHYDDDDALTGAVRYGHTDIVKILIANGAKIKSGYQNFTITANSPTTLGVAAKYGHNDIVEILLGAGAEISAKHDQALRMAVHAGQVDTVKLLIAKGANVQAKNNEALKWTSKYGPREMTKLLIEHGAHL